MEFITYLLYIIITNKVFSSSTLLVSILPVFQIVQLIVVLFLSIVSVLLARRVLGKKNSLKYFGL